MPLPKQIRTQSCAETASNHVEERLSAVTISGELKYRYPLLAALEVWALTWGLGLSVALFTLAPSELKDFLISMGCWLAVYYLVFKALAIIMARKRLHIASLTLSPKGLEWHSSIKPTERRILPWSAVRAVGWRNSSGWLLKREPSSIVINCNEIADYPIDLRQLSLVQRQQFFLLLSRFVSQTRLSPEALYMQVQVLGGTPDPKIDNFTKIWSEEFDRKFQLANHISLSPGHSCGNNRYTIGMIIASRLNSSTYLVCDKQGQRLVLKELVVPLNTAPVEQDKLLELFMREASLLARLDHPSIVKVKDFFVENGRHYLVMNYVPGMNLREYVRLNGMLTVQKTITLAAKLAVVLRYLHEQEPVILHRDFTPDNIVYSDSSSELTVVDFGAANLYATAGTSTIVGKQNFMAPEQFKGKATPGSDMYALGSTLCYLLTGEEPPGMGRFPSSLLVDCDPFRKLVASLLQFEQENRPTAKQFLENLTHFGETK